MGWRGRGGGRSGPWPGNGPFSYLPPWQRPGWLYGYGRGVGYGRGYGYGYWGAAYNPYVCRRFPWLPRWWWARPGAYGYPSPYWTGYAGYGYPRPLYPGYAGAPYPLYW
ncbi:hypothetical protein DRO42_02600 [Candidatus Bathyarchaeota archaeon]|nr:MAG: hypothetical protein DRO42_02600 [Candidatus Bathyarchaeota archaeon]